MNNQPKTTTNTKTNDTRILMPRSLVGTPCTSIAAAGLNNVINDHKTPYAPATSQNGPMILLTKKLKPFQNPNSIFLMFILSSLTIYIHMMESKHRSHVTRSKQVEWESL